MKTTKLYQILSQFQVYELNRLSKFIHSPYFNPSERLSTFYDEIHTDLKSNETDPSALKKERLWNLLVPNEPYNDRRFRKYTSDLLSLVEDFLALDEYKSNPIHQADFLLQAIQQKR